MKEDYIKKITEDAEKRGHEVRIRDVAYALLRYKFDADMAYMVVFGVPQNDNDVETYEKSESTKYLIRTIAKDIEPEEAKSDEPELADLFSQSKPTEQSEDGDITFEENKAAMVELIQRTEDALANGTIDTDKGLKIIADLRVKLNDKFKVADKEVQQYVAVLTKFNTICPHTRRECWTQTREFAMKQWHLIPDPKYKE